MRWVGALWRRRDRPGPGRLRPELLVVGLGNPGARYAGTRHNVGFRVCDRLTGDVGNGWRPARYGAEEWVGRLERVPLALIKPRAFVNRAGEPVRAALERHAVGPERLVVVHDDIDLAFARVRVRRGGSSGGHRGIRSIMGVLQTDAFVRVKIGVGRPPEGVDPASYVLQPFDEAERPLVEATLDRASDAVRALLVRDLETVMQEFNRRDEAERDPSRA